MYWFPSLYQEIISIYYYILPYTPYPENTPQYSRHNFNKFRQCFVIFVMNYPVTSVYKKIENLAQHCYVQTSYLTSDNDRHLIQAVQKEKNVKLQVSC